MLKPVPCKERLANFSCALQRARLANDAPIAQLPSWFTFLGDGQLSGSRFAGDLGHVMAVTRAMLRGHRPGSNAYFILR